MKFVAFDIETLNPAPKDRQGDYNLGVTCIGTCVVENGATKQRAWVGEEQFGCYRKKMTGAEVNEFVRWLRSCWKRGYNIVTYNGAGFDFRVLEVHDGVSVRDMALMSIDPFFQMLCEKGFGVSLDAIATGMGIEGKTKGMDGLKAIKMWVKSRTAQERVLEYVKQDALATARVYEAIVQNKVLKWITKRGKLSMWTPRLTTNGDGTDRMLRVAEARELPLPDTSWMDNPWDRKDYYEWMEGTDV